MSERISQLPDDIGYLVQEAIKVRRNASASYSRFPVGAALEDSAGNIWTGCNVESSSYGLSMCAERVALYKAISEGVKSFVRIAVVAGGSSLATPCGACRQVLNDYASNIEIILFNPDTKELDRITQKDLLPFPFSEANLGRSK